MEYDLDRPETWVVHDAPPCHPSFDEELVRIGGLNPFGDPMLRKVWGGTHRSKGELVYQLCETEEVLIGHEFRDPHTGELMRIKTLAELPEGILITLPIYGKQELGELRWIIEKWVSAEELKKQGYFDPSLRYNVIDDRALYAEAKNELHAMVKAGEDPEKALTKVENQLDRARSTRVDQDIKSYFDPEWRSKGDYQFFFRLERQNGLYHPADGEALEAIRMIWQYNQTVSPAEHEARLAEQKTKEAQALAGRRDVLWDPDNLPARQPLITMIP